MADPKTDEEWLRLIAPCVWCEGTGRRPLANVGRTSEACQDCRGDGIGGSTEALARFRAHVEGEVRKECAKLCESVAAGLSDDDLWMKAPALRASGAIKCADAIRAMAKAWVVEQAKTEEVG